MPARIDHAQTSPKGFKAVLDLEEYVSQSSGLEKQFLHLVKIRASQINGCAFCLDMHIKEARGDGFNEQWVMLISTWKESPLYSDRERAVLAWTESLTLINLAEAPDTEYADLQNHFSKREIVDLTLAVGTINLWNRLAIAMKSQHPVGGHTPDH